MTCDGCRTSVEDKLNALPEVEKASVNLETSEAIIEMSNHISTEQLRMVLSDKYSISEKNIFKTTSSSIDKEKSDLHQLFPLFLIFAYIIIASALLNKNPWDINGFMLDFMGLFYVVFSFFNHTLSAKGIHSNLYG